MSSLVEVTKRLLKLERRVDALSSIEVVQGSNPWTAMNTSHDFHLSLPMLRGYWPLIQVGATGYALDMGSGAHPLAPFNTPIVEIAPSSPYGYSYLATNRYYRSPSDENAFKITGAESYVASTDQGLTLGLWLYFRTIGVSDGSYFIFDKWGSSVSNRSYGLYLAITGGVPVLRFGLYDTSNNGYAVWSSVTPQAGQWYHAVGRFTPATEMAIFTNGKKSSTTSGIPASMFDSTAQLALSARDDGANYVDIYARDAFICAARLGDEYIYHLYNATRPIFGV